jgi:hypothetical protein
MMSSLAEEILFVLVSGCKDGEKRSMTVSQIAKAIEKRKRASSRWKWLIPENGTLSAFFFAPCTRSLSPALSELIEDFQIFNLPLIHDGKQTDEYQAI